MSRGQVTPVEQPKSVFGQVSEAVLRDLRANGPEESALGQAALVLAGAVDASPSGTALAALNRELRATLEQMRVSMPSQKRTPLDDFRERYARRMGGSDDAYSNHFNGSRRA